MPSASDTTNAIQSALSSRPVTVVALLAALGALTTAIFQPLGGSLTGTLPNPVIANQAITAAMLAPGAISGASVIVVPIRTATGSSTATTASDFVVCLNGPTSVQLEGTPPLGTTHVLKDCRSSGGAAITVSPTGSDTIDGAASVTFTSAHQAMTVSYSTLGWEVY